jgi:hypothetical protein
MDARVPLEQRQGVRSEGSVGRSAVVRAKVKPKAEMEAEARVVARKRWSVAGDSGVMVHGRRREVRR